MIGAAEVALLPRLRFALRPAALDVGRYARFAAFMEDQGLVESPPPVETYAVDLGGRRAEALGGVAAPIKSPAPAASLSLAM